jgi:hypothetical protein
MCYQPPGTGICVTFGHLGWGDASPGPQEMQDKELPKLLNSIWYILDLWCCYGADKWKFHLLDPTVRNWGCKILNSFMLILTQQCGTGDVRFWPRNMAMPFITTSIHPLSCGLQDSPAHRWRRKQCTTFTFVWFRYRYSVSMTCIWIA